MDKDKIIKTAADFKAYVDGRFTDVSDQIGEAVSRSQEAVQKSVDELKGIVNDIARTPVTSDGRKAALPISKTAALKFGMQALLAAPIKAERDASSPSGFAVADDPVSRLHAIHDDVKIAATLLRRNPRDLKMFREEYVPAYREAEAMLKSAFDIQTAGEGLEHISQDMSGSVIEQVRIERRAASTVEDVPMQHGTLKIPTWLTDPSAYGFAENTADTGGTAIDDGLSGNSITSNFTMEAKGIGLALTTSKFMEEDAVQEWLPFLRRAGVQALVNGEEDAMFNGDTTATHMDADINAVTRHVAKSWKGWRYVGLLSANPAKTDCEGNALNTDDRFRDYVLRCLGLMGKYGVKPSALTLFASGIVNSQLLSVEAFKTMYARGAAATNANGVITSPFGWNYILTEYLRTNLSASGVNTSGASTVDKTTALLVHTDSWKKGRVRQINVQLLDQPRALYDQDQLVFTMRQAFIASRLMTGVEPHVGAMFDIKAA